MVQTTHVHCLSYWTIPFFQVLIVCRIGPRTTNGMLDNILSKNYRESQYHACALPREPSIHSYLSNNYRESQYNPCALPREHSIHSYRIIIASLNTTLVHCRGSIQSTPTESLSRVSIQ
eukprot:756558_1